MVEREHMAYKMVIQYKTFIILLRETDALQVSNQRHYNILLKLTHLLSPDTLHPKPIYPWAQIKHYPLFWQLAEFKDSMSISMLVKPFIGQQNGLNNMLCFNLNKIKTEVEI